MSQRLQTGQVSVSGVAAVLSATVVECKTFILKAPKANTGVIYFGDSTVTTANGFPLSAGDEFEFAFVVKNGEPVFDLLPSDIYVVGTSGDKAAWVSAGR